MSDSKFLDGVVSGIAVHSNDGYGVKIEGYEPWFNGFKLPREIVDGCKVRMEYVEVPGPDTLYYNVLSIHAFEPVVDFGECVCPHCKKRLRVFVG